MLDTREGKWCRPLSTASMAPDSRALAEKPLPSGPKIDTTMVAVGLEVEVEVFAVDDRIIREVVIARATVAEAIDTLVEAIVTGEAIEIEIEIAIETMVDFETINIAKAIETVDAEVTGIIINETENGIAVADMKIVGIMIVDDHKSIM